MTTAYPRDASWFRSNGVGGMYHAQSTTSREMAACSSRILLHMDMGEEMHTVPKYSMCGRAACRKAWLAAKAAGSP